VDDARTRRLQQLLERLGTAIRDAVADAAEVDNCLSRLRAEGFEGELLVEAALLAAGDDEAAADRLRIHVDRPDRPEYLLTPEDARWLAAIGISPTRRRSHPQRPLPPLGPSLFPPAPGD
jgi:hypothetical protein